MEGTAMVTLATTLVGLKKSNQMLKNQIILFAGAGTAASGIGHLYVKYMMGEGNITK